MKKITRTDKIIEFKYSPFGQRIIKKVNDLTLGTTTISYYAYDANGQVMGIYDVNLTSNNAKLSELNIYGASRLGMIDKEVTLCTAGIAATTPVYPSPDPVIHILGYKKYEITNYLGNVNAVVSDRKIYTGGTYVAVMLMNSDYYPFGMEMPGRHKDEDKYRFGYNGMEKDDEVKDLSGTSYTTEFRQYDPRLGRWLSLDPLMAQFPWMSPYVAFDDNPVLLNDPSGLKSEGWIKDKKSGELTYDSSVNTPEEAKTKYGENIEFIEDETVIRNLELKGGAYKEDGSVYVDVTLGVGGIVHQGGNKLTVKNDLADVNSNNDGNVQIFVKKNENLMGYDMGYAAELANKILHHPNITLDPKHSNPDVRYDDANAIDNIKDVAAGNKSKTSDYSPHIKESEVFLEISMLEGILKIAENYKINISELSGAEHSSGSNHYTGNSVDISAINGQAVVKITDKEIIKQYTNFFYSIGATYVIDKLNPKPKLANSHKNHFHLDFK